ncbi:N-acyl homoserine lactonase family protein [Ramlibacter sp.]|uniref:N-acyl homoserine lactonase family protein n=1 Tax=Ramlibacter sp. TaxID=1917967 RepID=UPI001835D227|nr:N-acyl homoserine lactonase family protein [Ramlibacter sp.]MBA2675971.1 N-acyl homoserine lactonase family protein [Ramlibacter sp.]
MQGRWTTAARAFVAAAGLWLACGACAAAPGVRLYTLDCGGAEFADFGLASDTGAQDGRPARLANPCFLVRHPAGWLLWDAGLPPQLPAAVTRGVPPADMLRELGFRAWAGPPLADQLRALSLKPNDIRYIAFSHLHFDHTGNANLFPGATWILQRAELAWALAEPPPVSMVPELFSGWRSADKRMIDGDADVFGDGSVRILRAPGHTPGSSVLLLRLAGGGSVLLSGDLYLTLEGRAHGHVPAVNADRAATLASMERIETIARRTGARVVVQHAPEDFNLLPKLPAFLE